jgi:putative methanogenesis marker protein 3
MTPTIRLDGQNLEIGENTLLSSIVPDKDPRCCIAVIRPATRESARTASFRIITTQGEITIEPTGDGPGILAMLASGEPRAIHWHDRYSASFGPFASGIGPARRPHLYERGDVVLGCGGYDPKHSYLIFSKMRHSADFGADTTGGVIGRVVTGMGVIDRWKTGDMITGIEQVISWADTSRSFTTNSNDLVLEDGMEIISHVSVRAAGYEKDRIDTTMAESVEHLLLTFEEGLFHVGRSGSTHIADIRMSGTDVPEENRLPRREGLVTVRTRGRGKGSIFMYTTDIPASAAHTVVGQVTRGIELVRLAKEGDVFRLEIDPPRFDLVGLMLPAAEQAAIAKGIRLVIDTREADRVVVDQTPETTLECLAAGEVQISTVPLSQVIDITLDDIHAPASCEIFRRLTGLHLHHVGSLPLFFHFEDVYLFKPSVPKDVNIVPENVPSDTVSAGTLALTNDSRRGAGLVGVRITDNSEFGPTSEPFEGTNLIGKVLDLQKLGEFKETDIVFIREPGR